jgi:hypothetical protein
MEIHEPFHPGECFVQSKIMDIPSRFILIIIFCDGAFEYGCGSKFGGYVGTDAEPPCVEFCNFEQCSSFVKYLSYC